MNESVMIALRQMRDLEMYDKSQDEDIRKTDPAQAWDDFLKWHGMTDMDYMLHEAHESIFGKSTGKTNKDDLDTAINIIRGFVNLYDKIQPTGIWEKYFYEQSINFLKRMEED